MFSSGFVAKTLINTTKKSKSILSTQSRHSLSSINAKLGQFSLYLNTNRSIAFRAIQDLKHSKTTPLQKPYSTIATQMKAKKLAPVNSTFDSEMHIEVNHYDELIRSLPEQDRADVMAELESNIVVRYAKLLYSQLAANETAGLNLSESRTLFLAALRNLKDGKIAVAQLASMHILDSAIRTLCTNPMAYLIHRFVVNGKVHQSMNVAPLPHIVGMPSSFKMCSYNAHMPPKEGMSVSELPHRMQKPLMQRFFNFTESEWEFFCKEMHETQGNRAQN